MGKLNTQGPYSHPICVGELRREVVVVDGIVGLVEEYDDVTATLDLCDGGIGADVGGFLYISDIQAQDASPILNQVYQDPPNDTIIQSATVTTLDIILSVRASYPIVDFEGTEYTLPQTGAGLYEGDVNLTVVEGEVSLRLKDPDDTLGIRDTVEITLDAPPNITSLSFTGGYPGSQTELKEDDLFDVTVSADKAFDQVEVIDYEAGKSKIIAVAPTASTTVSIDIADRGVVATLRPARIRVRDATTGAYSATRDTDELGGAVDGTDVVNCNNLYPTVVWGLVVSYPGSQQALKGGEDATVDITTADVDTILVDSPTGELSIVNPTSDETPRQAFRIAGDYNVSTPNIRATATRTANNAVTVASTVINIANAAPVIDVVLPAARLRSGGNDGTSIQSHTIEIQSSQELLSVAMDEGASGTFIGSWAGGPSDWTRTLQVHDDDAKGSFSWQNLVATNLAGVVQNTINSGASYVLGGFVSRTLTFSAFATQTPMDVEVVDFSKLSAGTFTATNQTALKQPIGTPPSVTNGYTIDATGVNPTQVIWLDTAAAGSNSSGTAQITNVQEAV